MLKLYLVLSFLYCVSNALPKWNDLKVTWGINLFNSKLFMSVPRYRVEAIVNNWKLDKDCSKINGNRYFLNNDRNFYNIKKCDMIKKIKSFLKVR
jgi:hypothetical protein